MRAWHHPSKTGLVLVVLVLVGGCSTDDDVAKKVSERSIVERAPPLGEVLISESDISRAPRRSVRRAFLDYWLLLQHQALPDAVDKFDPGLAGYIGTDQILEAFKAQAPYFRSVKPTITGARSHGETATVLYTVKDINGVATPRSIRWRRIGGDWRVAYDPFLDTAIRDAVQTATQNAIDPGASLPSRRAVQAGYRASRLQGAYLKQQLEP